MRKYYSEEQEKKYGVVGIGVSVIDLEDALARQEQKRIAEFERFFPDGMK